MPTFTVPTYDMIYKNELGRFGLSWPVSYTVVIASEVVTPLPGGVGLVDPDDMSTVADAGSGEGGLAIFRAGLTYTITAGEQTILDAAGYTTVA